MQQSHIQTAAPLCVDKVAVLWSAAVAQNPCSWRGLCHQGKYEVLQRRVKAFIGGEVKRERTDHRDVWWWCAGPCGAVFVV